MSIDSEKKQIGLIVNRLLDSLMATVSSHTGTFGSALRRQIGIVRAKYMLFLGDGVFPKELEACFQAAIDAKVDLMRLGDVRRVLFAETPQKDSIASAIVQLAVVFCLSAQARLLTTTVFTSRDDVEAMMKRVKEVFDVAREMAADANNSATYQALTYLAGALTNHLAATARPLPKMVNFTMTKNLPALALSQRIYYDASRWEELVAENKVVHPLFMPREIVGLSK